jgi:hypothetical protein
VNSEKVWTRSRCFTSAGQCSKLVRVDGESFTLTLAFTSTVSREHICVTKYEQLETSVSVSIPFCVAMDPRAVYSSSASIWEHVYTYSKLWAVKGRGRPGNVSY